MDTAVGLETGRHSVERLRFLDVEVDFRAWKLTRAGVPVHLQRKPFQILRMLLERPGQLVTRKDIARELWPDLHVDFEKSLNTAVNALRQALGETSTSRRCIETHSGLGYRFVAEIEGGASADIDIRKGWFFTERLSAEALAQAELCFSRAQRQRPDSVPARSGMSHVRCLQAAWGVSCIAEAAAAAIEFARGCGEQSLAMANAMRLAGCASERTFRGALGSAPAHAWFASWLSEMNRFSEADAQFDLARSLDPVSITASHLEAVSRYERGDYRGAMERSWNTLTLDQRCVPAQYVLGLSYWRMGRLDDAITELVNACELSADPFIGAAANRVRTGTERPTPGVRTAWLFPRRD